MKTKQTYIFNDGHMVVDKKAFVGDVDFKKLSGFSNVNIVGYCPVCGKEEVMYYREVMLRGHTYCKRHRKAIIY